MLLSTNSIVYDNKNNEYVLEKPIGEGGFGIVYKALRRSDSLPFAVKTLNPFTIKETVIQSFFNEIKLGEQVNSPYIVHYEYTHDGSVFKELPPYIIMEYAPDGTLHDVIETAKKSKTGLSIDYINTIFTQLINGMEKLNETIIHRDIKPRNILRFGDIYKISDFGISKIVSDPTRTLTFKGNGSAFYAAPEAWNYDKNTVQMDIYSMGIVFYELATLQYPYDIPKDTDNSQLRLMHLNSPVKKVLLSAAIPQYLVTTILLMLEKSTQNRFKTWNEVRESFRKENVSSNSNVKNIVEKAMRYTNETEIAIQEKKAEEQRKKDAEQEYCEFLNSQFYASIYQPVHEFAETYNTESPSSRKMNYSYLSPTKNYTTRCNFFYKTPFNTEITFDFEIITQSYLITSESSTEHPLPNFHNHELNPKVNDEIILAWGVVNSGYQTGFNIILTKNKNPDIIYGNWYILENSVSSFTRNTPKRPYPFGFSLIELIKEIHFIYATHIYNTNILPFSTDYLYDFIGKCMLNDQQK